MVIVATIEPPSENDPYWVMSASAIHYAAQGRSRREAAGNFKQGLDQAIEWAKEEGLIGHVDV